MGDLPADEVQRRNERATSARVQEALLAALREALVEIAALKGLDGLDAFLDSRLRMVDSLRTSRPWEPPGLTAVRTRDAAAIEAALRAVVRVAHDQFARRSEAG